MSSTTKKNVNFDLERDLHAKVVEIAGDRIPKAAVMTALVRVALRRPEECAKEAEKLHDQREAEKKAQRSKWIGSKAF